MASDHSSVPSRVSATVPDPSREVPRGFWDPGRKLLKSIRDYQAATRGPSRKLAALRHRFWSVVTSCEIPLTTRIGVGLLLPHPIGIVVHPDAEIGPNCLLMHNVTLGSNGPGGVPTLGGHVDVGPGAALLGEITLGDHAVVGANAVVLKDVGGGDIVVGIPAKPLPGRTVSATAAEPAGS